MSKSDVYGFKVKDIKGQEVSMEKYKGKTLLVVNTASKCGYTPQYDGLEDLYEKYGPKGLEVLGFPCNQFGGQEPGDEKQISEFCETRFNIKFPMFSKVDVNGSNTDPLWAHLKAEAPGLLGSEAIKWNFTKFLIDADGKVITRYAPATEPSEIAPDIEKLLKK